MDTDAEEAEQMEFEATVLAFDYTTIFSDDASEIKSLQELFEVYIADNEITDADVIRDLMLSSLQLLQTFAVEKNASEKISSMYASALDKKREEIDQLLKNKRDEELAREVQASVVLQHRPKAAKPTAANKKTPTHTATEVVALCKADSAVLTAEMRIKSLETSMQNLQDFYEGDSEIVGHKKLAREHEKALVELAAKRQALTEQEDIALISDLVRCLTERVFQRLEEEGTNDNTGSFTEFMYQINKYPDRVSALLAVLDKMRLSKEDFHAIQEFQHARNGMFHAPTRLPAQLLDAASQRDVGARCVEMKKLALSHSAEILASRRKVFWA